VDLPRIVTILFVAIVTVVGILLTSVGARPNLLHLSQSLPLLSASSSAAPAASSGDSTGSALTLSPADFEAIINQVLARSGNASSPVLSVFPGKSSSWLFDSACCNHMTPYASLFTTSTPPSHTSLIHTADGSSLTVQTIGTVHTPSLSVFDVFHMSKLSFNLLSVGQLCELGYRLVFYSSSVYVQDPRTG
jgi:hypothetical protein